MAVASDPGQPDPDRREARALFQLALDRQFNDLEIDLVAAVAAFDAPSADAPSAEAPSADAPSADDPTSGETAAAHLRAAQAAVIATVHRQELRYDEAGVWFDRALEAAPARTWSSGLAMVLKAGLLAWQGHLAAATDLVDDAASFVQEDLRHVVDLQRAYLLLAADRLDEALELATTIQQGADDSGDLETWAMAGLIQARVDYQRGRYIAAELSFRSLLVRPEVQPRIRIMAGAGLGLDLAAQGAMSAAIERLEQARLHFEAWPRGEMEFGATFATVYLDANLLELADRTAARTLAAAIRLDESIIHATALMVQGRVELCRGRTEIARQHLAIARSMFEVQDRLQPADRARRLLACLDSAVPPDWLTVEHFSEDPTTVRALLVTAHANPDRAAHYWAIAARGVDAEDPSIRAMARFAIVKLDLEAGRLAAARRETARLLEALRQRTDRVDALDVRAAGFELVDVRSIAVGFALAGEHDLLFEIIDSMEQTIFDFVLVEDDVATSRSQLEAFRSSLAELPVSELDADELVDLDRRITELRPTRTSPAPPPVVEEARVPRIAFVAANNHLYRATYDETRTSFVDIGSADHVSSMVRRLRFAVAAASIDLLGAERIQQAAVALQEALFSGLEIAGDNVYSIRPGQYLISVPWRLLPLGRNRQIALRIRSPRPRTEPSSGLHRVLSVACSELGEYAAVEAAAVGAHYTDATLLIGPDSTADAFLAGCSDHDVVHIAGYQALVQRERLVTTLLLGGGPVTMFDLGQLPKVAPIVIVASSRVNAVHSMTHDVNLALAQTLIARGAHEVVVSPIDLAPETSSIVLPALHEMIAAGHSAAVSLGMLRFDDDELQRAADCLVCIEAESSPTAAR